MTTDPTRPAVLPDPSTPAARIAGYGAPVPRDFHALRQRVEAVGGNGVAIAVRGETDGYPLLAAEIGDAGRASRRVLLTGGVHGDEPAGVEAVLRFLEQAADRAPHDMWLLVLPCINPHGWIHGTRENRDGLDINRSMDESGIPIVDLLKGVLGERHFDLALDLHEDYDGEGFYLYEAQKQDRRFGEQLVAAARHLGPPDCQVNEDDIALAEGVMAIDPAWGTVGWSSYTYLLHAEHGVIVETASKRSLDERLAIHGCVVDEALRRL